MPDMSSMISLSNQALERKRKQAAEEAQMATSGVQVGPWRTQPQTKSGVQIGPWHTQTSPPAPIPVTAGGGLLGAGNMPTPQTQVTTADDAARAAAAGAAKSAAASSAAAGRAGQLQEQGQAGDMATASQAAAASASIPPPPAPGVPANPGQPDDLYGSALKQLAEGLGGAPTPGTQAAITQNREAMATYARSAQNRAAAVAAKNGAIGQGTAHTMANAVRGDVLGELANSELGNTQLVSAEKQAFIDKAMQAGQFAQTRQDNNAQFAATMEQRKAEFDKNFGATEAANYRNQLERMALDNPVLASKLTSYLLEGKTGAVGAFTDQEKGEIQKYVAEKKGQQDKLTEVMNSILGAIPGQIQAGNKVDTEAASKAAEQTKLDGYTKKLNTLPAGGYLTEEEFKALEASGGVKRYSAQNLPTDTQGYQALVASTPHGIISVDGTQYRIGAFSQPRTGAGTFSNQERHTDVIELIAPDGTKKYAFDGKIADAPPKTVSNDFTPLGF